jgi:hypothetical protein
LKNLKVPCPLIAASQNPLRDVFTTTTPKITADSPSKLPNKNSLAPTTPAARIQLETPGEMVSARPIQHSTQATEQPTAAPNPLTMRLLIRYDPWIVDDILQLANPDVRRLYSASVDISMFEFFFICHLRPDDEHTLSVMDNNDFYH